MPSSTRVLAHGTPLSVRSSYNASSTNHFIDWTSSPSSYPVFTAILVLVVSLLVLEQWNYRSKKKQLPGATWTLPIIGKFADSLNPTMAKYKESWKNDLSVASVFNIFIVMASSNSLSRKIFTSPMYAEPCLVASAKSILGPNNWVFLTGKVHAEYRKGLNLLFTRRALALYTKMQERIRKEHFTRWLADTSPPQPYMMQFRDLNLETSLRTFCGDYITAAGVKEIGENYWLITQALELVNFPLALPGTKVYKAVKAMKIALRWLEHASCESKKRMAAGGEPNCMIDGWNQGLIESGQGMDKYSDNEKAMVIISFIFASQDAMSSALTFAFQLIGDHPKVLAKIREEQEAVRQGDYESDVTVEQLEKMIYTRSAIREVLRLVPPVIMVPYLATKDFPLTEDYTVPKGSIVIPSLYNSLHDPAVYPDPETFAPERFMPGGVCESSDPKNFIVFGAGPHKCIGYEYVYLHLTSVLGAAAATMDWSHERTKDSDEIQIICTLFPKDGCRLKFTKRQIAA